MTPAAWRGVSRVLRHARFQRPLRAVAVAAWAAIALLPLAPHRAGPDGCVPALVALGAAFALAGLATRLAFRFTQSRWQVAGISLAAALLALARQGQGGAPPALAAWLACSAGALAGVVVARTVDHLSWRPTRH